MTDFVKRIDVVWLYDMVTYMIFAEFAILGFILSPPIGVGILCCEYILACGPAVQR
jgi:hypothetical protein